MEVHVHELHDRFVAQLQRCILERKLEQGRELHRLIARSILRDNRYLGNLLVSMYGKCGSVNDAQAVFDSLLDPNVYSWNLLVSSYVQNGQLHKAKRLFERMPARDLVSWNTMISAFFLCGDCAAAAWLFASMPERDVRSWNAMVSGYAQSGRVDEAREAFDMTPEKSTVSWNSILMCYTQACRMEDARRIFDMCSHPDMFSWNLMLTGYARTGHLVLALELFNTMPFYDVVTWNAILSAFTARGKLDEALKMFRSMRDRDLVSWNTMIAAYAQAGEGRRALYLFLLMDLEGVQADAYTFVCVLNGCSSGSPSQGKIIYVDAVARGYGSDARVATALLDLYGKCGEIDKACALFERGFLYRDLVMWNTMINISSPVPQHAFVLFGRLSVEGLTPDDQTFLAVLMACFHGGLVTECRRYFKLMKEYEVIHTHQQLMCVIDLCFKSSQSSKSVSSE